MDSLGNFLKETRLNTDISIGQIAKDTNIAKKYLEALENEEYSIFPGDTYLKGFLRSYASYLDLDANEIIRRYERIKIAESPTPIDKLIPKPKMNLRPFFVIFFMILFLGTIVYGGIILYQKVRSNKNKPLIAKNVNKKKSKKKSIEDLNTFNISAKDKEKIFDLKKGDIIEYLSQNEKYTLKVKELTPIVVIEEPAGTTTILIKSYTHKFDLNSDNKYDLSLNLNTWDSESANITMKPLSQDAQNFISEDEITPLEGENTETIAKVDSMENIEFSIDIQDPTFLRYKIDNDTEIEKYYDQRIKNMISARNRVIIWLSNAGAVTFNFNNYSKTYSPGKMGQIMVKVIQWSELASGEYELQISSLN